MMELGQQTFNDPKARDHMQEEMLKILAPLMKDKEKVLTFLLSFAAHYQVKGFHNLNGLIRCTSDFSSYLAGFNSCGLWRIFPEASSATKL